MDYASALRRQLQLVERLQATARAEGPRKDSEAVYILTVEHDPPVITLGRSARAEHVLVSRAELARRGIELHESKRGGDVTWHGPGQLVAYVIRRLDPIHATVHDHVWRLEEAVLWTLREYGIVGERVKGRTGVWTRGGKIAAIGVAVARWVAYHGVSLNVSSDLAGFGLIVPCGIHDRGVTSVSGETAQSVGMDEVKRRWVNALRRQFADTECVHPSPSPPPRLPSWLKRRVPAGGAAAHTRRIVDELGLNTVCDGARCPNKAECFARHTATFMILGERCARACRFCAVEPALTPEPDRRLPVREDEPEAVAEAAARLGLRHVVVTSVTRDDLPDGGAAHFARTCRAIRARLPQRCRLDGLPYSAFRYGSIALRTRGSTGVVAAWSK